MSKPRVAPAEITGLYGAVVRRIATRMFGRVPEPLGIYWHNRKVLNTYFKVSTGANRWDSCDPDLKSFAHMATSALTGCSWCLDYGYFHAFNEKLDVDKAREVPRWRESTVFTPLERDVLEYAEAMTVTPPTVTDELAGRLREQLGAEAFVELTAWIAVANFYNRSNIAFGIESEGYADACELAPLAAPSGVASDA